MDLAQFDLEANAEAGAAFPLRNPINDTPLKRADGSLVTITVQGADGETYRRAQAAARLALLATGLAGSETTRGMPDYLDALAEQTLHVLVAVTTGWSGIEVEGETWPFEKGRAHDLYRRFPWVRTQVDAAINNRALFNGEARKAA